MKLKDVETAEAEAKRFLARCKAAKAAFRYHERANGIGGYHSIEDTKATGALRRASMDLTRALADVRRPNP